MSTPSLLIALLIALFLGALYNVIRNGGASHLIVYLIMSIFGFVAGHMVGIWRGWILFPVGSLNLGMEIIGALVFLIFADWLIHLPPRS